MRLSPIRVLLSSIFLAAACAGILLAVRTTAGLALGPVIAVLGGIVFTLIPASVLEWLVHRYVYHRRQPGPLGQIFRIHHQGHHALIFPTWRYTTNGPVLRHPISEPDVSRLYPPGWRNWLSKLAHFGFYLGIGAVFIVAPAALLALDLFFLAAIAVTSVVLSDLFVRVHDAIHYPGRFRLVEAQPWYPFIDRHHFIHHVDLDANVNFLLPLADLCYGTLRTRLTAEEVRQHGTLEEAKAHLLGHSEPAAAFADRARRAPA